MRSESSCRERGDNKYIKKRKRRRKTRERREKSEKDRQMIQNGERSVRVREDGGNTDKMDSRLKIEIKRAGR